MPQQIMTQKAPISDGYQQQMSGLAAGDYIEVLSLPPFQNATVVVSVRAANRSFEATVIVGNPYTPSKAYFEVHWSEGGDRLVSEIGVGGGAGGTPVSLYLLWERNDATSPIIDVQFVGDGPRTGITWGVPLTVTGAAPSNKQSVAIDKTNGSYMPNLPAIRPADAPIVKRDTWSLSTLVTDEWHVFWTCPLAQGQTSQHYIDLHVSNFGARYSVMQFDFAIEWRNSDGTIYQNFKNPFTLRDDKTSSLISQIRSGWKGGRYDLAFKWALGASEGNFSCVSRTIAGPVAQIETNGAPVNTGYEYGVYNV